MSISLNPKVEPHFCDYCHKEDANARCGRCKQIYYCNALCQKQAWAVHKAVCKAFDEPKVQPPEAGNRDKKWPPISTYIFTKNPLKYGIHHDDYVGRSRAHIRGLVGDIDKTVASKGNLERLFPVIIKSLSQKRAEIATLHKTEDFAEFSLARDGEIHSNSSTPLIGTYIEYGERIRKDLSPHLTEFLSNRGKSIIENRNCLGRDSSLEFSLIPRQQYVKFLFCKENIDEIFKASGIDPNDPLRLKKIQKMDVMIALKDKAPDVYKRLTLITSFRAICVINEKIAASLKNIDWIVCAVNCKVGGLMQPISHYLIPVRREGKLSEIDPMVTILHQDPLIIRQSIRDCAQIFKTAIEWDEKEGLKELQNRVGHLIYLFSHAMPYSRGSAALSEWIETAIYNYHDIEISYNPKKMVNLEALILSLPEFIATYDTMVHLQKKR